MKTIIALTFAILLLSLAHQASAGIFDHSRRGFCLGAGVGLAPLAGYTTDYYCFYTEEQGTFTVTKPAFSVDFFFGYGLNRRDILTVRFQISDPAEDDPPCTRPADAWYIVDYKEPLPRIYQIYSGPVWYHFFRDDDNAVFSEIGLGAASHDEPGKADPGWGFLFGGGFETGPGWLISLEFSRGISHGKDTGQKFTLNSLNLMFTRYWY